MITSRNSFAISSAVAPSSGAVDGDDAAEGAHRIAGERLAPGLAQRRADGDAAGIGVLDDGDRRRRELGDQLVGGIGVVEVVVAELLALDLLGGGDARPARRSVT